MANNSLNSVTSVMILQHPQEPFKDLGTAGLVAKSLKNSKLIVGLSWPNLEKAWGEKTEKENWIALYLGSIKLDRFSNIPKPALLLCDKKNNILGKKENEDYIESFKRKKNRGIILIDGTWSQAKTLWWRNAWLSRIQRAVLLPPSRSLYGRLRKEPRKESQSTIETIAYCLGILEKDPSVSETLIENFKDFLKKFKK